MAAFNFPDNPGPNEIVTNNATGVSYQWDGTTWVVVSSNAANDFASELAEVKTEVDSLQTLLPLETQARQQGDASLQSQIDALDIPDAFDPAPIYSAIETESRTRQLADEDLQQQIDGIDTGTNVNLDDYYTKDEIDNQFTLRGTGYVYLMSSFSGTVTIRPGEVHTDNRLVGQITFISLGQEDDNGKQRRDAVVGDTIEIYDSITAKYYRYEINSGGEGTYGVTFQGADDDRNDPLSMGQAYLFYLYPTHISSANYYDKNTSDDRFMQLGVGSTQYCNRITEFNQTVKYNGAIGSSKSITTKQYVDTAIAGLASVQYVNDEVDKMLTSFSAEDAEPDIFYGDYPPTGDMKNGNLWFDSMNLRLNVWTQGTWVNPDRNDGQQLENRIAALEARLAQLEGN